MTIGARIIRTPRGSGLSCKGRPQEAARRMLMTNLDPDVPNRPDDLLIDGGSGRAMRNWLAYEALAAGLRRLNDETPLMPSGKPAGAFRKHSGAPRVLALALLRLARATWKPFLDLEDSGLDMFGQMTVRSWIYIQTQGILLGAGGLDRMGGARPLAVTMNGSATLVIELDGERIAPRLATGYVDESTTHLEQALDKIEGWRRTRGVIPHVVTDETSAHDTLNGYVTHGMSLAECAERREHQSQKYIERSMARHVAAILAFRARGAVTHDDSTKIRAQARDVGEKTRLTFGASCRNMRLLSSVRAKVRPAGPRSTCFQMMRRCADGFAWRACASRFRNCPRASAGSDMAMRNAHAASGSRCSNRKGRR